MISHGQDIPGSNIIANDRIRPPDQSAAVSSYTGYGSYSGADIKVVVHYPNEDRVKSLREAEFIRTEIQKEIASFGVTSDNTPEAAQEWQANNIAALNELDQIDQEIKRLSNMPTSKVLAELQTISWSTHRDKAPVRTFGAVYPRSYVRSNRSIAGTMIFTIFYEHVLHELLELNLGIINTGTSDRDLFKYTTNLIDQVPPIDISIIAANEYGAVSHMGLYGLEFVQDGATFSIDDIYSESVVQYVARDIDPMRIAGLRKIDSQGVTEYWVKTAKGLTYEKNIENSYLTRRSPFI